MRVTAAHSIDASPPVTAPAYIATAGLLVLFPGFFLYHFAIANGWIPPFAGGLFAVVAIGLLAVFLPLIPWAILSQSRGATVQTAAVSCTVAYFVLWTTVHYLVIGRGTYAAVAATQALSALLLWVAMVFVGAFALPSTELLRKALPLFSLLIVLSLLYSMVENRTLLGPYMVVLSRDVDGGYSSYQGLGRSVIVTSILLASISNPRFRAPIFICGAIAILSTGSRSDFFTLVLLTLILALVLKGAANRAAVLVLFPIVMIAAWPIFLQSRFSEILDLSQSTSWQARTTLTSRALDVIRQSPILGDFGYHARELSVASYAHNALSAWAMFGLLGFLMYAGLIVYFTILSLRKVMATAGNHPLWFIAFFINLAVLIQGFAAASVFSVLPAFGWGIALNALRADYPHSSLEARA
jgi:hypothetical protein